MEYFDNQREEVVEGERSSFDRLARPWPERIWEETGLSYGGGVWEQVMWEMGSADQGGGHPWRQVVGCEIVARVGTTLGERGVALSVWTWDALFGATGFVGVEIRW